MVALLVFVTTSAYGATPEETLRQAQQLEKNGGAAKAIPLYEEFLKDNPTHSQRAEARYRLGKCYDAVGMVDQAVAALSQLTEQSKKEQGNFRNRPDAFYALAKLHASNKKYDEAIKVFERLLGEGAGLYEDEVLGLTGGYYAILGKYEDAAGKFNLLRRKGDPAAAEQAAYKLAMLWLRAGDTDRTIAAIQDLAGAFPRNDQIAELLLRTADLLRQKKDLGKAAALCEQIRQRYPKAPEAAGAAYLLGVCYRDKGEFARAAEALDALGRSREPAARTLAAEAALAAAEVYFRDLKKPDEAMPRFEEAAKLARESEGERRLEILEQCYFRLAEHHYSKKTFAVALDYYTLLRATGSRVNVLSRILDCQAQLNKSTDALAPETITEADVELLRKRITEKPGTSEAAEAELFLLDRRYAELSKRRGGAGVAALGPEYEKIASGYPKEALAAGGLSAYAWQMAGMAYAAGSTAADLAKAVAAFERAIAADPTDANPYRQAALENIAICAERAGDKARANKAYTDLLALSKQKLAASKDDKAVESRTLEYLKSLATRADTSDVMDQTIALTKQMIADRGPLSDLSRESRFYLGELYLLKKDYSAAAATFAEFVRVYGPKQGTDGELAGGPWKPARVDEKVRQVYEAAARVAHAWSFQGHDQNTVKAYGWVVRNLPSQNKHVAEAQYVLGLELLKGKAGESNQAKRRAAETLWTTVVNPALPTLDLDDTIFRKGYYFWLTDDDARKYVRHAMMKAGQLFSETDDHETAAAAFREYLTTFETGARGARRPGKAGAPLERDELADIARYALGREYAALKRAAKVVETFRPYLNGHRDDRFRISGLRLMALHAAQAGMAAEAVEAYATILDEYGENRVDERGRVVPVSVRERLKQGQQSWDGVRLPVPKGLDLGDVRYALGFLYWKADDYARCAKALGPFLDDAALKASK
ncbi:MAG TPA: tetratricopeptide repeat protein, partial [Tepidisphaeraceae bacterium]|nr:tetratricopeptide repeat protein [Tepidisphaeraceae bacterium]